MKGKKGAAIPPETVKMKTLECEVLRGSLSPSNTRKFKLSTRHREGNQPLYGISYNFLDSHLFDLFATVGGNRVGTPIPSVCLSYVPDFYSVKIEFCHFSFRLRLVCGFLSEYDFFHIIM